MSIGATLQHARAARGLTSEQMVRRTRIPLHIIMAMEQDDWASVPPGIFARGNIRAYAREVGLDGNALVAQFDAERAPLPPPERVEPAAGSPLDRPIVRVRWPTLQENARRWLAGPAFVMLLLLVYIAGRLSAPDAPRVADPIDVTTPAPVTAMGAAGKEPRPVATTSAAAVAAPSVANPGLLPGQATTERAASGREAPIVADVEVTRACWVSASADATRVVYRLLQPGERVQARGRVLTLRVGDAGALRLSLDGAPAKPLGASGHVVSLRITRDNYRSLLSEHAGD